MLTLFRGISAQMITLWIVHFYQINPVSLHLSPPPYPCVSVAHFPPSAVGTRVVLRFGSVPSPLRSASRFPPIFPFLACIPPFPTPSFLPASFSPGKSTRLDTSKSEVQQRHSFAASASALPHFQPSPRHFILIPFCVGIYFHSIPRHFPTTSACRFMLFIPYAKYAELWGITQISCNSNSQQ